MANPLIAKTVRTQARKLVGDMNLGADLLLNPEVFTQVVMAENPRSPFLFFGMGVGDYQTMGATENQNTDQMFTLEAGGIGSSFINIKEVSEKYEAIRVTANNKVPGTILANTPFEFSADKAYMDEDEFFLLRDQQTMGRVISRRITATGADFTAELNGLPGESFNGHYLFEYGAAINMGFGNSQGEGSKKANTLPGMAEQYNTLFNPMVIMRYVLPMTGSYMADEQVYTLQRQMGDGTLMDVNTGLSRIWLREVLSSWEHLLLYSRANFNPQTKEILGRNSNAVRYNERPAFAGIYQMLDLAPVRWTIGKREGMVPAIKKVKRIMQTIADMPGGSGKIIAMCSGVGAEWLRHVIREGGLAINNVNIQVTPNDQDMLTVGFKVDKFVTDHGELYIYDVGKSMTTKGEYDQTEFDGMTGGPRSNDIFFFPTTRAGGGNRPPRKVAKYFAKEGQVDGHSKVSRGFVFGISSGITGKGNGFSASEAMQMQDSAMKGMMNNSSRYSLNSITDGDEYHALVEGTIYIDARGTVKLTLK